MAISGGLFEDGTAQVEAFDDALRSELEVLANELDEARLRDGAGPEGVNADANRLGYATPIGERTYDRDPISAEVNVCEIVEEAK